MTPRQRKKLVNWMRKNGVLELEEDGFKIKLDPYYKAPNKKSKQEETSIPTTDNPEAIMPGDGDLLYWSTGSFEDIQEGRKKPAVNEDTTNGL